MNKLLIIALLIISAWVYYEITHTECGETEIVTTPDGVFSVCTYQK